MAATIGLPILDRVVTKIRKDGQCTVFTGKRNSTGYGLIGYQDDDGKWRHRVAHRVVWEAMHGPVPDGLELDHLCRNRACVNVFHLEPVSHTTNVRRGAELITHCPKGHPYDEDNTLYRKDRPGNHRGCRECTRTAIRAWGRRGRRPKD